MKRLFAALLANVIFSLVAFSQTQTIRGTVTDQSNGLPLTGAFVFVKMAGTGEGIGATTDTLGRYRLEKVPVGRQQVEASYLGYKKANLTGLLIETGKEFILHIQLEEKPASLGEVVVTAAAENNIPHPLSIYQLKVEEQFRYPTTYFDPARLAMSLPGVAGVDDQGNSISVRGNSPASVRWRLEGVDIVNPNHTANAGTFSDRPTAAGGGVNILSAQLLGASNFLTGAYPAGYGNALGGIMDMYFRKGNDERHEFTAQAGLIGVEAAAEGPSPFGGGREGASYLVNYRYSFVGLLTAAGADFGGEEITFQDLSFHLNFPVLDNAEISFFGVGGLSENIFSSPLNDDEIEEEKDLFDIDFTSKMGAAGLTFKKPLNKKIKVEATAVYSGLEHERSATKVVDVPQPTPWNDDRVNENKWAFSGKLFYKKNARQNWDMGVLANREQSGFNTFFTDNFGSVNFAGEITGWLVQPFINTHIYLSPKIKMDAGLHGHYFTETPENAAILPRAVVSFFPNNKQQISLAYGVYAQIQSPQVYLAPSISENKTGATKSQQITAAFQHQFDRGLLFKTEVYHQHLSDVPVSVRAGSTFSILNNIENFQPQPDTLANTGKGRNYGVDVFLERPVSKNYFARLGGSLYRSLYTDHAGTERSTRFDGRYLMNATLGREKAKNKAAKTVILGYSTRLTWYGGFRQTPVDEVSSADRGYTVFEEANTNAIRLKDYYRLDFRIYWKWNKPNRSSTFSVDIQNVTNRKNDAFLYFDQVQQQVVTRKQLGLIPLMSWRVEF